MDFDGPNFFIDLTLDQIEPKICDYDYNLIECTGFPPTPASSTNETDVSSPDNANNNNNTSTMINNQCFGTSLPVNGTGGLAEFAIDSFHHSASTLDQNVPPGYEHNSTANYILFNESNVNNSDMSIFNDISISGTDTSEILSHLFEESIHMDGLDSIDSSHIEQPSPGSSITSSVGLGSISPVSSPLSGSNNNCFLSLGNVLNNQNSTPSSTGPSSPLPGNTMLTTERDKISVNVTQHLHQNQQHNCNKKRPTRNRTLKSSGLPVLLDVKSAGLVVNSSKACFVLTDEVKKVLVKDGHFSQMPKPGEELTKEQQKIFRKAERKVRNKLSAQNSRLKRKEINENLLRNKAEQDDLIIKMRQQLKDKDAEIEKLQAIIARNMFTTENRSPTMDSNWNNVVRNNVMLTQAASNSIDFD